MTEKAGSVAGEVHIDIAMQPLFKGNVKHMGRVGFKFKKKFPQINLLLRKGYWGFNLPVANYLRSCFLYCFNRVVLVIFMYF